VIKKRKKKGHVIEVPSDAFEAFYVMSKAEVYFTEHDNHS
jgi:hypothetical protein